MARFDHLKGCFGLLPTPYAEDYEIHLPDLKAAANFCCTSGQHGIVWPVMVGEFYFLGEEERIRGLDAVLEEVNGRLPVVSKPGKHDRDSRSHKKADYPPNFRRTFRHLSRHGPGVFARWAIDPDQQLGQ